MIPVSQDFLKKSELFEESKTYLPLASRDKQVVNW
jgi:hypothetical protein